MSNGYAVEMKDITKKFGGLTAVDLSLIHI